MSRPSPQTSGTSDHPGPALGVQIVCYLLLVGLFAFITVERCRRPLVFQAQPPIEPERIAEVRTRVDPNTAGWAELARLPGIGESLARTIVAFRQERRPAGISQDDPSPVVFRCLGDLAAIPGLGEKKLREMEPYLVFPE